MLFFPDDFSVFADFKDTAASGDELGFVAGGLFDFSRHTVSFGKVVSLGAVFDLELHVGILEGIWKFANDFIGRNLLDRLSLSLLLRSGRDVY